MGITIAYKGTLNNPELVEPLCEELSEIAREMNFEYQILDEDYTLPHTAYFDRSGPGVQIKGHLPLKGISISLHPGSEALSLYFDRHGKIRNLVNMVSEGDDNAPENEFDFIKTQYAPAEVHMIVIKLLRYIKLVYSADLTVEDEGAYWETNDEIILHEKREFLRKKIDEVKHALVNGNIDLKTDDAEDSLVDKIEKILTEKYGKADENGIQKPESHKADEKE